jgi:hypothetical protein
VLAAGAVAVLLYLAMGVPVSAPTLPGPYLHFGYNLMVTVPMALALWDQSKRVTGGPARP